MLVRINVHVLDYAPGDEVDLPKEWSDILVAGGHATKIKKSESNPEALEAPPEDQPDGPT